MLYFYAKTCLDGAIYIMLIDAATLEPILQNVYELVQTTDDEISMCMLRKLSIDVIH